MNARTITPAPRNSLADEIREHEYAILQTRIERVPGAHRSARCGEPQGCSRPATLVTFAVDEIADEGDATTGLYFVRDRHDEVARISVCDEHRSGATHGLYYLLTGRTRPDGIRAFDLPGQHLNWA